MNDYERSFKKDVKEKKALAASSRHKKNGSKSKKVTLPSDGMTRKQWESKNGEVMTVYMNQPMTYTEFKRIPNDLQEVYLACLINRYRVSSKHIADMMGTDPRTLRSHIYRRKFNKVHFRKGSCRLSSEEQADWDEFLSRRDIFEEAVIDEEPETPNDASKEYAEDHDFTEVLKSVRLRFEGRLDISVIMSFLQSAIGEKASGELQIVFRKSEEAEDEV